MKYQESNTCARRDLEDIIKKIIKDLLHDRLCVEGTNVEIPRDAELDVKVKYATDEEGGSVTVKVCWENYVEEAEEEEEEEEKY